MFFFMLLSYLVTVGYAFEAATILDCPKIHPHSPATSVYHLRVDDIQIIAAMGDSITAGMLAKNTNLDVVQYSTIKEYRGVSFTMGGDTQAASIANYIKHFQPDVYGASLGEKPARLCQNTFFCLDAHHDPEIDFLNAAQTGATSDKLPEQVDYLVQQIGLDTPHAKKWKLIHLYIGYNDASVACMNPQAVRDYKNNVRKSLEELVHRIDYAFINLIGLMRYDKIHHITDQKPGYKKKFVNDTIHISDYECYCCSVSNNDMGQVIVGYNQVLAELAEELNGSIIQNLAGALTGKMSKNIAVVFQPMNIDISSIPYYAFSNVDGYHPNVHAGTYLSRELWNQMFLSKHKKAQTSGFNTSLPLFCPTENDVLETNIRIV